MESGCPTEFSIRTWFGPLCRIVRTGCGIRLRCATGGETLLKVVNDIVDMFNADRDSDHVFGYARVQSLLFAELLVGSGPRMNGKGLRVTDTATR